MGTSDCDNGAYGTGTAPSTGLRDASVEPDRTGFSCPTCGRFIVTAIEGCATPSTVRPGGSVTMPAGKRRTVAGVPMCQRPRPYSAKEVVAGGSTPARVNKTLSPRTPNPTRHYEETQYEATVPVIVDRVRQAQVVNALEPEWRRGSNRNLMGSGRAVVATMRSRPSSTSPGAGCPSGAGCSTQAWQRRLTGSTTSIFSVSSARSRPGNKSVGG